MLSNLTIGITKASMQIEAFLAEFVHRFLQGGVFEETGLYAWHDEIIKE
ncbi:hypothetical protein [Pedobacter hiemivivus]|nr:hypothetical protein [Pedobacter hiemivivus]